MKSYHGSLGVGIDGIVIKEHDVPTPGPHEVLIRVKACSLNNRELLILKFGYYPLPVKSDVVLFSDGVGEVTAIGEGVTHVKVGDRVAGVVFQNWFDGPFSMEGADQLGGSLDGMLTEYIALPEDGVVHIPDHLSYEEAAALPCAAVTAWNAVTGGKPLQAGDSVLTLGSGNVSLFAIQFAKLFGARVIATTSSDEKAKLLTQIGADEIVNYRTSPEWYKPVRQKTEDQGVDHVVEVGGSGTILQSVKATRYSGEIAVIGGLAANKAQDSGLQQAIFKGVVSLRGVALGSRAHFLAMNRAISVNQLRPIIDRIFPFNEAKAALHYYDEKRPFGKVIISLE